MAAVEQAPVMRTYGGWRRPDTGGLGNMSTLVTVGIVLGPVFAILIFLAFQWVPALIFLGVLGVVLLALSVRDKHHRTVLHRVGARGAYAASRGRGGGVYRSGPLSRVPWGRHQLPGLLAQSRLSEGLDSYGRPFALIHIPSTRHYTVVLGCEPDGMSLVDEHDVNVRVAQWGQWLANLSHEPGLDAASVTIETAPDSGTRLRREVASNLVDDAPALAKEMFAEVMDTYPAGSAVVRGFVTLTYKGDSGKRRSAAAMAHELASRLPSLTAGLNAAGAGVAVPLTAQQLCETIRVAYDPASAGLIDQAHSDGEVPDLTWEQVGPVAARAGWDTYRHDSGLSRTWEMTLPPRGEVYSDVLNAILHPIAECDRKRVTIHYRPYDPARAAHVVESDKDRADFRISGSRRPSSRAKTAKRAAERTADEEARGAGLLNFSMLVTATVAEEATIADASAMLENLAASARVQLRPVHGSQDAAFAAALPLGLILSKHVRVPQELRELL